MPDRTTKGTVLPDLAPLDIAQLTRQLLALRELLALIRDLPLPAAATRDETPRRGQPVLEAAILRVATPEPKTGARLIREAGYSVNGGLPHSGQRQALADLVRDGRLERVKKNSYRLPR